jgi:hypothetical protein
LLHRLRTRNQQEQAQQSATCAWSVCSCRMSLVAGGLSNAGEHCAATLRRPLYPSDSRRQNLSSRLCGPTDTPLARVARVRIRVPASHVGNRMNPRTVWYAQVYGDAIIPLWQIRRPCCAKRARYAACHAGSNED